MKASGFSFYSFHVCLLNVNEKIWRNMIVNRKPTLTYLHSPIEVVSNINEDIFYGLHHTERIPRYRQIGVTYHVIQFIPQ